MGGLFSTSPDSDTGRRQLPGGQRPRDEPRFDDVFVPPVPSAPPEPCHIDPHLAHTITGWTTSYVVQYVQPCASANVRNIIKMVLSNNDPFCDDTRPCLTTLISTRIRKLSLRLTSLQLVQDMSMNVINALNALDPCECHIVYWLMFQLKQLMDHHWNQFHLLRFAFLHPHNDVARKNVKRSDVKKLLVFMQPDPVVNQFVTSHSSSQPPHPLVT